jgi:hypothetical protein
VAVPWATSAERRLGRVLDVEARTVRAGEDEDRFGQLDRQLEVDVAVEQFGLELEGRVVRGLEQLGLLFSIHASAATMTVSGSPAKSVMSALTV